jgi:Rrf2 family cysteine metabolism transcriptional repressor
LAFCAALSRGILVFAGTPGRGDPGLNISVKGEYALRAVFYLASQPPGHPIKIAEIARHQTIPQKFLELILASLKQGGFVESRRGADGGYLLSRQADMITVGEVLRFVEERRPERGTERRSERRHPDGPFSDLWEQVDRAISDILDSTTFAHLVRNWQEQHSRFVPNWEI